MRIHFSDPQKWNAFSKYCLYKYDVKMQSEHFLLQCTNFKGLRVSLPSFYECCIDAWCKMLKKPAINTQEDVLKQKIFGNHAIVKQGKSLFFPHWMQSDITTINDIWDKDHKKWKKGSIIFNKLVKKQNWISEFNRIKDFFPEKWKQILKDANPPLEERVNIIQFSKTIQITHSAIKVNSITTELKNVKQRDLYYIFLYPVSIPSCVNKWNEILDTELTVEELFKEKRHCIYNRKSYEFHWKTLNRSIFSEMRLKLMKKSNGKCKLCNVEDETICHLIYECHKIKSVWSKMENFINNLTDIEITFNKQYVLTGLTKEECDNDINAKIFINFLLLLTKWCIWKHRNDVKYGKLEIKNANQIYDSVIKICKKDAKIVSQSLTYFRCEQDLKIMLSELIENE